MIHSSDWSHLINEAIFTHPRALAKIVFDLSAENLAFELERVHPDQEMMSQSDLEEITLRILDIDPSQVNLAASSGNGEVQFLALPIND